jgi:hypothetical protein
MIRSFLATLACVSVSGTAAAQPTCIPQREAEALFLTAAPQLIQTTATTCAPRLPVGAILRSGLASLTAKYAQAGDSSWPLAKEALKKLTGPDASSMIDSDYAKPMLLSLIAPMLAKEIKAADCPNIDRILTIMNPLPARNTASLVVAILEMTQKTKKRSDFTLCSTAPAARP